MTPQPWPPLPCLEKTHNGSIAMKLGISKKLFILFSVFILIFYGTVFDVFLKVQDMSRTSARIVSVNHQIAQLAENLVERLLDMEINHKKFRLLKKDMYYDYFETARTAYVQDLNRIEGLDSPDYPLPGHWKKIAALYSEYTGFHSQQEFIELNQLWDDKTTLEQWRQSILTAARDNDNQIQKTLIRINDQSRRVVRNGIIGFGISIVVGGLGILFISKTILTPLSKFKAGLTHVSKDNYDHTITIDSKDEFSDLADTFNDMSRQLAVDEEIRSDFIATLSHEIRTPLSSIQESVNMVTEELLGPVNARQKKFLELANSEITRITHLLNHLLDISMLESGSGKSQYRPLNPDHLITEALRLIEPAAAVKQISLEFKAKSGSPPILGEAKEIMQVLMNIIGNAVKFSDENGKVAIGLSPSSSDETLTFSVSDTGPGIPPDKHSLIFKKYYRTKAVRKHMSGVGLGLSISRRIVRAHGGQIGVEKNTPTGSTFWFSLPVCKTDRKRIT